MLVPMWRMRPPDSAAEYQALAAASQSRARTRSIFRLLLVSKIVPMLIVGIVVVVAVALCTHSASATERMIKILRVNALLYVIIPLVLLLAATIAIAAPTLVAVGEISL
jgi:hypothetical protein